MNNLSEDGKRIFQNLVLELARAYSLWVNDHSSYYQEINKSRLIFTTIDSPLDLKSEISRRISNGETCIHQLFHTEKSLHLSRELSVVIRKCGNLNCLPHELYPVIDAIAYEYINSTTDDFFKIINSDLKHHIIVGECFKKIVFSRVEKFKK